MKTKTVRKTVFRIKNKRTGWYRSFNTLEEAVEALEAPQYWEFKNREAVVIDKIETKTTRIELAA